MSLKIFRHIRRKQYENISATMEECCLALDNIRTTEEKIKCEFLQG